MAVTHSESDNNLSSHSASPAISIIVPVYKVEQYLPKCLDSIQAQIFPDFECLLIDDGSPDNAGNICDDYASRDSRFRVFHQPNGGVSKARNLGLNQARGAWITFVDPDDYITEDYLSTFMDSGCPDEALMALSSLSTRTDGTSRPGYTFADVSITKADGALLCQFLSQLRSPWGKFYSRNLIVKNQVYFPEQIHLGEDTVFLYEYIALTSLIVLSAKPCYYSLNRRNSLSRMRHPYHQLRLVSREIGIRLNEVAKQYGCEDGIVETQITFWKYYMRRTILSLYQLSVPHQERVRVLSQLIHHPYWKSGKKGILGQLASVFEPFPNVLDWILSLYFNARNIQN